MQISQNHTNFDQAEQLLNGLTLYFIEADDVDEKSHKAAISLSFSQGHFHCDSYPEGFAHLFEHMLFNASTKYRKTDALDAHLFKHHGQVNGWTEDLTTTIHMSCDLGGFVTACNIFLDRIYAPLFMYEDIEREIKAIDAEFCGNKVEPLRQLLSVQKASSNPSHPFSRFSEGNKQTLSSVNIDTLKSLLHAYHKEFVEPNKLTIAIGFPNQASESKKIANVKQKLIKLCKQIKTPITQQNKLSNKSGDSQPASIADKNEAFPPVYLEQQLNSLICVKQHSHQQHLIVTYIIDTQGAGYINPLRKTNDGFNSQDESLLVVISQLLESKHQGGLLHHLQQADLANDLHSTYKTLDKNCDELILNIQLSEAGIKSPILIYQVVQRYINFLNKEGIEDWRFREKANQYKLSNSIKPKSSLVETCVHFTHTFHKLARQQAQFHEVVNSNSRKATPTDIHNLFGQLKQHKVRLYFISSDAPVSQSTLHYKTGFSIQELPNSKIPTKQAYGDKVVNYSRIIFRKPRQNPYMCYQHSQVAKQFLPTHLIHLQSNQINFKFFQDIRQNKPHGECFISITEPNMHNSSLHLAIKKVWLDCLNEYLASQFFDVDLASLHFRAYAHHHGITIHTSGISEKQLLLCIELINAVRQFRASEISINRHLKKQIEAIQNKPKQRPLNQMFSALNEFYLDPAKRQANILNSLISLSTKDVNTHQDSFFKHNYVESLMIGSWSMSNANRFFTQLNGRFHAQNNVRKPSANSKAIVCGAHIHLKLDKSQHDKNQHALVWHYVPLLNKHEIKQHNNFENPIAQKEIKLYLAARAMVLEKLLTHSLFNVIRQQHNMAYTQGAGYKPISRHPGIAIYVVSSTHSLEQIHSAMKQAIVNAKEALSDKSISCATLIKELVKQVTPHETEISQTAKRAWLHFDDKNPLLGYKDLINVLHKVTVEEIEESLDNLLSSNIGQVIVTSSTDIAPSIDNFEDAS